MAQLDRNDIERILAANARLVLRGGDLSGADLSGLDLRHVDLAHAVLVDAQLFQTRLDGACLFAANLTGARAIGAHLRGADLRGARLHRASFRRADLQEADLRQAEMSGTDFIAAEVDGALIDEGLDLDCEAIGFGQPTRQIGAVIRRGPLPAPTTRGPLTEIPDLDDVGVMGFDGIPDLVRLAVESEDLTDQFIAAAAFNNLGPRVLIAGGLPTLLEALRSPEWDVPGRAIEILAMCGEDARPALAPLIVMATDSAPETARSAVYALGAIGLADPGVLAALQAARHHAHPWVRTAAEQALVTVQRGPQKWD